MSKLTKKLESTFENFLWKSRVITLLAVIFSLFSSLTLFLAGSLKILDASYKVFFNESYYGNYNYLLSNIIASIDLYLIGVVLLIFSFGLYELFISKIDPAKHDNEINILNIKNLDDLKNRLLKVIIMALIVHFFKTILDTPFHTTLEMVYLAGSILMISACTFFIRKVE